MALSLALQKVLSFPKVSLSLPKRKRQPALLPWHVTAEVDRLAHDHGLNLAALYWDDHVLGGGPPSAIRQQLRNALGNSLGDDVMAAWMTNPMPLKHWDSGETAWRRRTH